MGVFTDFVSMNWSKSRGDSGIVSPKVPKFHTNSTYLDMKEKK